MRITFVVNHRNLNGGVRVIAIYAERLAARGHAVTVVSRPRPTRSFKSKAKSLMTGKGWPADPNRERSHLDDLASHGVTHRIIDRRRPIVDADVPDADVVIATWWETAPWVDALSPAKGAKAYFVQDFGAHAGQPIADLARTWHLPMHKVSISGYITGLLKEHGPADHPISYAPNGVDFDLFHAPERGKQARPTVGHMYSRATFKGSDICLKAVEIARASIPDLHLIGFGLHDSSDALPLPTGAEFTPRVPDEKLREVYARCDAWLFGPRMEGFGLPILEAMACRTPVIATPAGAAVELVEPGGGVLVPHDDPAAMAAAIVRVCSQSDAEWRAMSGVALATAKAATWEAATDAFERALFDAAEHPEASGGTATAARPRPTGVAA